MMRVRTEAADREGDRKIDRTKISRSEKGNSPLLDRRKLQTIKPICGFQIRLIYQERKSNANNLHWSS